MLQKFTLIYDKVMIIRLSVLPDFVRRRGQCKMLGKDVISMKKKTKL